MIMICFSNQNSNGKVKQRRKKTLFTRCSEYLALRIKKFKLGKRISKGDQLEVGEVYMT